MPPSQRFQQLSVRITEVDANLLPAIDINGNYSTRDLDLTRAYCLLCHAEIEAYVEDIVREVVRNLFAFWKADKSKIPEIIFHLACNYRTKNDKKEPPASLVHLGMTWFENTIDKNHGIKVHNIESLFNPIGYSIDKTLVTVLDNFGTTRGDIAHQSFRTQQQIDPAAERNAVTKLVTELEKFDADFYQYKTPMHARLRPRSLGEKFFAVVEVLKN